MAYIQEATMLRRLFRLFIRRPVIIPPKTREDAARLVC